ncbi:MAG: T9SS type A sorting domain-containing protein [Flavobacteriaceae bacterium]|nr:T9SS type A sorting domain-containing protein [Flavobacteriaceae bacterium]
MNFKLLYLSLFFSTLIFAQDYSGQWEGYYSYLNITGIAHDQNNILASAENAIFKYNPTTQESSNTSTIHGLTGETISYYYYSDIYATSVIGYENGLVEIVTPDKVITVVGILNKPSIPPNAKRINHIYEFNGLVYLSCDFGISAYSLDNLEFEDNYFIGNTGGQISVKQTTVLDQYIYAATTEGIKRALHANPNIIDFSLWETLPTPITNWKSIVTFNDRIYAIDTNGNDIHEYAGSLFNNLSSFTNVVVDHRISDDKMLITTTNDTFIYDLPFTNSQTISHQTDYGSNFTVATTVNGQVYIGTENDGILHFNLSDGTLNQQIKPNGPSENNMFTITATNNEVWAVYGKYSISGGPSPKTEKGFSHLKNDTWINTPYDSVLGAANLINVSVNPFDPNQVFMTSFWHGFIEVNNDIPTTLYNETNTSLEIWLGWILSGKSTFDPNGKLWFTTVRVDDALKVYDPQNNTLNSFSLSDVITDPVNGENSLGDIEIDQNNTKWIATRRNGVIGLSENNGNPIVKKITDQNGNLPVEIVKSLAIDNDNNLWIGTRDGLRVLYNTAGFFSTANPQAESIIILEEGIPKELMFGQSITDIKVDESNNKWVATLDAGVFLFSPDGQNTIYHFTKNNSPLPSNGITDMAIDHASGLIYFATEKGMVSFNTNPIISATDLENVVIQPNPVRPSYNGNIIIKGLVDGANIKITDISGNLVDENTVSGGTYEWDQTAFGKHKVASGVYIVMITTKDGEETTIEKIMIVR